MSKIIFKFEGLSVFFIDKLMKDKQITKNPALLVGLLQVDHTTAKKIEGITINEKDYHFPEMTISELTPPSPPSNGPYNRTPIVEQRRVKGDFSLSAWSSTSGLELFSGEGPAPELTSKIVEADFELGYFSPEKFSNLVTLSDLYKKFDLAPPGQPNPALCQARFSFNNGILYSMKIEPVVSVGTPNKDKKKFIKGEHRQYDNWPAYIGLEVEISEGQTAWLLSSNGIEKGNEVTMAFEFKANTDYEVLLGNLSANSTIENQQDTSLENHWLYYYSIFDQPVGLDQMLSPGFLPNPTPGDPPNNGEPFCSPMGAP